MSKAWNARVNLIGAVGPAAGDVQEEMVTDKGNNGTRRPVSPTAGRTGGRGASRPVETPRGSPFAAAARRMAEEEAHGQRRHAEPAPTTVAPPSTGPASQHSAARAAAEPPSAPPSSPATPQAPPAWVSRHQLGNAVVPAARVPAAAPTGRAASGKATTAESSSYSPWWKRVLAALLDAMVLGVPYGILGALAGGTPIKEDALTGEVSFDPSGAYIAVSILSITGSFAYYVLLEGGRRGPTVGKMALGIQVRDASGGALGYGRALGRRLVAGVLWWLLILPGLLDALSPLWDRRRQTWHDKAVNAVVGDKL